MKMIIVIIKDNEADALTRSLTSAGYRITRVASTGGFLHSGVATLLLGVEDEKVDAAIALIRETVAVPGDREKRGTLFVVPVSRFEQV